MITNEKQYKITKAQAQKFFEAYNNFDEKKVIAAGIHEKFAKSQREALQLQYNALNKQLEEYDKIKTGVVQTKTAHSLEDLPKILIMSRIAQDLTQAELAEKLNLKTQQIQRYESDFYSTASLKRLYEVSQALGVELKQNAEFILNAKTDDIWKKFPINEMHKRNWFDNFQGTLKQANDNAEELITDFLCAANRKKGFARALHKKNPKAGSTLNHYALLAWQARIVQKAFFSPLKNRFDIKNLTQQKVNEIVSLSSKEKGPLLAKQTLEKLGIHLIIEEHLEGTHLDGAAMKGADDEPIIGMTLRYNRIDNFWFVLLHELAHIIKHLYSENGTDDDFIDEDIDTEDEDDPKEIEANDFARNALIPTEEWESSPVRFFADKDTIIQQAKNWNISPAIIAGRILRETGEYKSSPDLVRMLEHGTVKEQFGL